MILCVMKVKTSGRVKFILFVAQEVCIVEVIDKLLVDYNLKKLAVDTEEADGEGTHLYSCKLGIQLTLFYGTCQTFLLQAKVK